MTGEQKIVGAFKVLNKGKNIVESYPFNNYPLQVSIISIKKLKIPIEFNKELIKKLSFIKDKEKWGLSFFRRSIMLLPDKDGKILIKLIKSK